MAICTDCGSLYQMEDHQDHSCETLRVPKRGEEILQDGTKRNIKTKVAIL